MLLFINLISAPTTREYSKHHHWKRHNCRGAIVVSRRAGTRASAGFIHAFLLVLLCLRLRPWRIVAALLTDHCRKCLSLLLLPSPIATTHSTAKNRSLSLSPVASLPGRGLPGKRQTRQFGSHAYSGPQVGQEREGILAMISAIQDVVRGRA